MKIILKQEDRKILSDIHRFARNKKVGLYLVGGYLRDLISGREKDNPDMDFCLERKAIDFGKDLSRRIQGGFVVLDKEHGACRIVKKMKNKAYTLDFTDFRGKTIAEDLFLRDFTVNSLAAGLEAVLNKKYLDPDTLIDLYNAKSDLKRKLIRAASPKSFKDDPLRILRAFSLSAIFGFTIDKGTIKLMKPEIKKLAGVSPERIRDELFKILDEEDSFEQFLVMDKLKVLPVVLPEIEIMRGVNQGPYHHLDVLKHSFETLKQADKLITAKKQDRQLQGYLNEVISAQRKRRSLLKFAALLHDIGKPKAKRRLAGRTLFHGHERVGAAIATEIARRLKLSNDEINILRKMVFWHLRPGYLADNEEITPRAIFRYFRDTASEGVSTLLVSIADQRSTKGVLTSEESRLRHEKVCFSLIKKYFKDKNKKQLPRLINGNDIINKFKLQPSVLIGQVLANIEELQAIGAVKTKKEALSFAQKFINDKSEKN